MIEPAQLLIFIPAALALNLTPGSDLLFCLGQSLKSGPRAGVAASFGIATGSLIHTVFAAFGLASLLAAAPIAFEIIRWAGVAYLLWLGFQALTGKSLRFENTNATRSGPAPAVREEPKRAYYRAWRDGTIVNLLNPKVIFFILAFIPQFVVPENGSTIAQFLIYGAIFNITGTIVNALVGLFGGHIGHRLRTQPKIANWLQRATAMVFVGLAVKLALDKR